MYATINAAGRATGFYDPQLHATIPAEAIEISVETWSAWIADTERQRWDGTALVACDPPAAPPLTADQQRARRNARLAACDWTQGADAPLTTEARAAWAAYRAALRDVPEQPGFPAEVTWPNAPG
ncbi:phage tail assembly chaperone [Neoroseomonas lacus]|uniref:Phage tail assembly chaperone-like domain-containing protein n=1 Tax=Neoroseomonas lacus TaxID=287609 RepID=A0A917KJK8_9PROT|nr:phage tail assembly chaperone [Neoroseomonas lacus]GGJ14317.1 hypothetical protein GCM10011320_21940 [Neoroseomonas lacus]